MGLKRVTIVNLNGFFLFVWMNLSKCKKFGEIFILVLTLMS